MLSRPAEYQDCVDAIFAFAQAQNTQAKPWQKYVDFGKAFDYLVATINGETDSYLYRVHGYVVMLSQGESWHGIKAVEEEAIVRVADGGRIEDVLDWIKGWAMASHVSLIGLGTAYAPDNATYADRLLSRGGHVGAHYIYLEVTDG